MSCATSNSLYRYGRGSIADLRIRHHERDLSRRLANKQHERHDITVSTLHVHLIHAHCMEVSVLHGPSVQVMKEANALIAERGVHHGRVHTVSVSERLVLT